MNTDLQTSETYVIVIEVSSRSTLGYTATATLPTRSPI